MQNNEDLCDGPMRTGQELPTGSAVVEEQLVWLPLTLTLTLTLIMPIILIILVTITWMMESECDNPNSKNT